jgi:glycosyltransferase involved in cell wall biosynthesis
MRPDNLCLVIPCYNEEQRLKADAFRDAIASDARLHLCFVNDGSTDHTSSRLSDFAALTGGRAEVVNLASNAGKAGAVRAGMLHALSQDRFAFVGFWDADLSTPLDEVGAYLNLFTAHPDCVLVMGSRWQRLGASIRRSAVRHYLGRVFATLASLTLDLPVYDTQCGAKMFRASAAGDLFAEPFVSRWCFDVELLARLGRKSGRAGVMKSVIELPLSRWHDVAGSKLRLPQMLMMPIDLMKIRAAYPPRP